MTSPDQRRLDRVNPSPTVHNPPPEVRSVRRLTSQQVGVIGSVIVDLILAQVALALGGINILGVKPFAFLTTWGEEIQQRAAQAFNQSVAAEAVANSAEANQAIAIGQSAATSQQLQDTQLGLQTTWNGLWEANTGLSAGGQDKPFVDVKQSQNNIRLNTSGNTVNIQGTWDNIWNGAYYEADQVGETGKDLISVRLATGAIVHIADLGVANADTAQGTAEAAQDTADGATGSIQNTWDELWEANTNQSVPSGANKTLVDLRQSAVSVRENADGALSAAETAQSAAETAQGTAEGAQSAAETAQGTAEGAQSAAETAQGTAEGAQSAAETAQGAAEGAQQTADGATGSIKETWQQNYEGTYGLPAPDDIGPTSVGETASDTGKAIDALDGRLVELESSETATLVSGESFSVQFSNYSNGYPGAPWTVTLKSGTNGVGIRDGRMAWTGGSAGSVSLIYNTATLTSPNQKVTVSAQTPTVTLYGRSLNTAATTCVYATVSASFSFASKWTFTTNLYAVNAGSVSLMKSQSVPGVGAGSNYTVSLICGETINGTDYPLRYKVTVNGVTILSHDDTGASNAALAGRYCGFGMSAAVVNTVLIPSGEISGWSSADTKPATYLGSGARLVRNTTTASSSIPASTGASGTQLTSVFNSVAIAPNSGTMTAANGAVTVLVPGWYAVDVHMQMGEAVAAGGYRYAGIYIDGSPHCWGTPVGAFGDPPVVSVSAVVYCAANTVIAAGYRSNQAFTVVGEPSGYRTNFSVAFCNNTKPASP